MMTTRFFIISILTLSVVTGVVARAVCIIGSEKMFAPTAEGNCTLKPSQMRTVYGFRLGMNLRRVIATFPEPAQLSALVTEKEVELNLTDRSGNPTIRASRVRHGGVIILIYGDYLRQRFASKVKLEAPNSLRLIFWREHLMSIDLSDMEAARWRSIDAFVSEVSKTYGFSMDWWKTPQTEAPLPVRAGEGQDFRTTPKEFDCGGLRVSAYCIGPPAPAGICSLSIRELNPAGLPKS